MAHQARKRFGQNFLHDASVISRIINSIQPTPADHIIEIGPGQGALTVPLLTACGHLDAIELDRDLIEHLTRHCAGAGALTIHNQDALKFDFRSLRQNSSALRIVGNLPYNISTPLLFHLLEYADIIQDMFFMLQKEVVDRIGAAPGGKNYGRLSVMTQLRCRTECLFSVPPQAFHPVPKVFSAVIKLTPRQDYLAKITNLDKLAFIVKQSFSMKRKTLRNNLKDYIDNEQLQHVNIDPARRAETLTLDEFIRLGNLYDRTTRA